MTTEGDPPRPRIGATARTILRTAAGRDRVWDALPDNYLAPLRAAGAIPLILPNGARPADAPRYLDGLDGLLLSGGDDPDPSLWGEEPHPAMEEMDSRRDAFEVALVREAHARDLPLFGICRGIQILNVALGGDLYQDIPSQTESAVSHRQKTTADSVWHSVEVVPQSVLASWVGPGPLRVNSYHHQACRRVGEGLHVSGRSPDGLIEALEDPSRTFCVAVEWHPEVSLETGDPASGALFAGFLEACAERARTTRAPASNS